MTFDLAAVVASFLGGSLFTALVFVFAFMSTISSMKTTLINMERKLDDHIKAIPPVCQFHQQLQSDVEVLKDRGHGIRID